MCKDYLEHISIVIDPFDDIGYPMPQGLTADAVVISHEHHDHNNLSLVHGNPSVIRTTGIHHLGETQIELIKTYHDEQDGTKRGINHLIKIKADGLILLHCGDLGHIPDDIVISQIKSPDVLLVPVGEIYTLSLHKVIKLIKMINPGIIFPMHYQTSALSFKLGDIQAFLEQVGDYTEYQDNMIELNQALLTKKQTIVLTPNI